MQRVLHQVIRGCSKTGYTKQLEEFQQTLVLGDTSQDASSIVVNLSNTRVPNRHLAMSRAQLGVIRGAQTPLELQI